MIMIIIIIMICKPSQLLFWCLFFKSR